MSFLLLYISSPPPFFVPLAIKFYERRNGFSRLIAWIFSTIKRFKLTNNIFTTTFRGEIESGNFCLNSCTAFERSEATTCRFNRQHKVITWLRYENTTRILRSRARAFPFASLFRAHASCADACSPNRFTERSLLLVRDESTKLN